MARLLVFIDWLLGFYAFILIVAAGMSWLIAFDVISARNNLVKSVLPTLFVLTEPALRPIRRFVPPLGGLAFHPHSVGQDGHYSGPRGLGFLAIGSRAYNRDKNK